MISEKFILELIELSVIYTSSKETIQANLEFKNAISSSEIFTV